MPDPRAESDVADAEERADDADVEGRPAVPCRYEVHVARQPAAEADEQEQVGDQKDEHRPVPDTAGGYDRRGVVRPWLRARQEHRRDEGDRARARHDEERRAQIARRGDETAERGTEDAP